MLSTSNETVVIPAATRIPRRLLLYIALAWVATGGLDSLTRYIIERIDDKPGIKWSAVVFSGAKWIALAALTPITYFMARRYPVQRTNWRKAIAAHVVGSLGLWLGWVVLGMAIQRRLLAEHTTGWSVAGAFASWLLSTLPTAFVMYFAMLGIFQAYSYFAEARERETQALRLSGQLAEAKLDALRRQLNPHFLFNSLNAISVLVREQKTRPASRTLELLSDFLRQVLSTDQPNEVALNQELQFVERYLAIEQVRFGDRLRVEFDVDDPAREALVPTLILQPLVENAVRYGVACRAGVGVIQVAARVDDSQLHVAVRDDGIGFDKRSGGNGVGLSNTRERLRTLYGDRALLSVKPLPARGTEASIVLPYQGHRT